MVTGYDVQFYRDVERSRKAVETIAAELVKMTAEMRQIRELLETEVPADDD
jgi:hypothetical protein